MIKYKQIVSIKSLNFKQRREALGLSLRKVEKLSGINYKTIWNLEKEGVNPEYMHVKVLNDFYNNYK